MFDVLNHYGKTIDEAIQSSIGIGYTDAFHGLNLNEVGQTKLESRPHEFWQPIEEWEID